MGHVIIIFQPTLKQTALIFQGSVLSTNSAIKGTIYAAAIRDDWRL